MSADFDEDDDESDLYFSEIYTDAELTGKEPKFLKVDSLDTPPADLSAMKIDELIKTYRAERDQLATDRKAWKAREARVKSHLGIISAILRDRGDQAGVDNFATAQGTAYRSKKDRFTIQNWDETSAYVLKTGNVHMLQKRVSPNAVREIMEADGALPPGLEHVVLEEFAVRSPSTRKR